MIKKDIAASVATLRDMMRQAGDNGSRNPWHIILLDLLSMLVKVGKGTLPFFSTSDAQAQQYRASAGERVVY